MTVEGKEIYGISIPLAAGTLATACFSGHIHAFEGHYILALCIFASLCASTFPVIIWSAERKMCAEHAGWYDSIGQAARSPLLWLIIFFILGAFCCATDAIVSSGRVVSHHFAGLHSSLEETIDAIPFKDSENNALIKALILGERSGLSTGTIRSFRNAGAAHLLALSGMHLGIIYLAVGRLLLIFGNSIVIRKIRSVSIIILCGFYTLLCGAGASLVRAWLFILLNESAKLLDRPQPPQQIFCSALTIHLIFKPSAIMEVGFQLSYLAMMGIVFVWPRVRGWYGMLEGGAGRFSPGKKIWEAASLSICCQLFTAPLTLVYFGTFPKYFLITNLVAAPLMTVVMLCGLSMTALTQLSAGLACRYAAYCEWPVSLLRRLLETIAGM